MGIQDDPNVALLLIRRRIRKAREAESEQIKLVQLELAAQHFDNLDHSLSNGGKQPAEWANTDWDNE